MVAKVTTDEVAKRWWQERGVEEVAIGETNYKQSIMEKMVVGWGERMVEITGKGRALALIENEEDTKNHRPLDTGQREKGRRGAGRTRHLRQVVIAPVAVAVIVATHRLLLLPTEDIAKPKRRRLRSDILIRIIQNPPPPLERKKNSSSKK